jgi:PAS domain S-box-containing protein
VTWVAARNRFPPVQTPRSKKGAEMSIKVKMYQLSLVITACVSAMAVTATISVGNLSKEFRLLRNHEITTQQSVFKVSRDMNYLSRLSRDIMLGGDYSRDMNAVNDIVLKVTDSFEVLETAAEGQELKLLIANANSDAQDWLNSTKVMMTALGKIPMKERHTYYPQYERVITPKAMQARDSFAKILKHAEKNFQGGVEAFEATISNSASSFIIVSLCAIIIIVISFFVILRTILAEMENRRFAEEALSASDKTARALLDGIDNSAYLIDPEGTIVAVNATAAKRAGMQQKELVGSCLWSHYGQPDVSQSRRLKAAQAVATGEAVRFEDERGGRVFDQTYYPVFNDAGAVIRIAVLAIDVTEQRHAIKALEQSERRFRTLIEHAPIGISLYQDLHCNYVNRAYLKIFGFADPSELIGTHICERSAPQCRGEIMDLAQGCVSGASVPYEYETVGMRQGGAQFPVCVDITMLVFDDGPMSVAFTRDLTERQQARDLMVQAEKMAMIGGLAAGMAHEINNPVGIIIQNLQNIERRLSDDLPANVEAAEKLGISLPLVRSYLEQRSIVSLLAKMYSAGERTTKIVSNILQFSRKSSSERKPTSLPEVIEHAVELAANDYDLKKKYDFRNLTIVRDFAPDLPQVPVNATEFEQVIINLLKNAAQAMAESRSTKPEIHITASSEAGWVVVKVSDNGPGMEEGTRKRIFEPFFTTKEVGVGTGLGLSVSYTLITQNHKGIFTADSAPGEGALFTIKLPLV